MLGRKRKVWVLIDDGYEPGDAEYIGIFTSQEKAEAAIDARHMRRDPTLRVEVIELDKLYDYGELKA